MTFENPIWLAITPLIALLSISLLALGWRKRSHLLGQFAAARLLERLTQKASVQRRLLKSALIVAALTLLGLALARPQFGVEWSERKARGLDIIFALDSSKSMLATDLRPTRLERGKLAILDLIDRLESDRIGLVAFAGQAFLQTPPTLDYGAFRESLNATDPSIVSRGGSDIGRAIEEAAKAFPAGNNVKVVVLLTDGEDLGGQTIEAARTAGEDGIQIFTIGIGTPQGEYLRIRNQQGIEEFVRDQNGQPVRSQLDESTLQQVAKLTGGSYTRLGGNSLETLYDTVLATLPREERESELQEVCIERFQWLLAAALFFLILEILIRSRRPRASQAIALTFALGMLVPHPSEAQSSKAVAYNDAHSALIQGDYAKANELYTEAMRQTNDRSLQRDALFNMGHATYQLGRSAYAEGDAQAALKQIRSAEKLFDSALELDPDDSAVRQDMERTRKVRETIEKFLEQQKEQQDQESSDQSERHEDSESEDQQGSKEENEQQDEGSEQEQQNQQDQSGQGQENQQDHSGQEQKGQQEQGQSDQEQDSESQESQPSQDESPEEQSGQSQSETGEEQEQEGPEPTAAEEQSPEEAGESEPVPQVGEPEEGESSQEASGGQPSTAAQVEGMTIKEAQDLLDSLRGKEEILPFAKPAPGKGQPLQDW